jgi:CBS domain containing-hemolysin-like protein
MIISFLSENLLNNANLIAALFILIIIVFVGIVFDTVGIAVTAAKEEPFHAMASDKVEGSRQAVLLVRNAEIVSNICNDMIGDICGIVSGAAGAAIILNLSLNNTINNIDKTFLTILITSITATLTVGGKAIGKIIAISRKNQIVYKVGYILYVIKEKTGIQILREKSKNTRR